MRPLPAPPTEHALHDELLVARFAAGDELPEDERPLATRLVAECPACASLTADLRVIARAVASEALPPRRRDFRITAEQAEHLRGSPVRRFLRRLTLPEAAILRPAAAAVMSLGLLLVVVGTVVPGSRPSGGVEEPLSRGPAAADTFATQRPEAGGLAPDTSGREAAPEAGDTAAMEAAAPDDLALASPTRPQASETPPGSAASDLMVERQVSETLAAASSGGTDLGALLVVVGVVLTLGGLLVLLLALLARRLTADPLVR